MMSQTGQQTITIHILISQEVKPIRQSNLVSQLNITWERFIFKNYLENRAGRLVPDIFIFKKTLKACVKGKVKASGQHLSSNIFW